MRALLLAAAMVLPAHAALTITDRGLTATVEENPNGFFTYTYRIDWDTPVLNVPPEATELSGYVWLHTGNYQSYVVPVTGLEGAAHSGTSMYFSADGFLRSFSFTSTRAPVIGASIYSTSWTPPDGGQTSYVMGATTYIPTPIPEPATTLLAILLTPFTFLLRRR